MNKYKLVSGERLLSRTSIFGGTRHGQSHCGAFCKRKFSCCIGCAAANPNANFEYACMSIDKTALRALAQMLNAELKDKGIFAGIVEIMGVVGSNDHFAPKNIAEAYWQLYSEKNSFEYIFD